MDAGIVQATRGWVEPRAVRVPLAGAVAVFVTATVVIAVQQLYPTPLGLPGHRGLFWLGAMLAARLALGRTGVATGAAVTSSALILAVQPSYALHCVVLTVAGLLVDALFARPAVRTRPWLVVAAAPVIHLVAIAVPMVRLAFFGRVDAAGFVGWVLLGHLFWGLAAGLAGLGLGLLGRRALGGGRPA